MAPEPAVGEDYRIRARAAALKHGVDPALFLRLVGRESAFNPRAVSPKGAIGLGQLMPETAADLGVDPTDPAANLEGSARYLRQQLDRFGDYPRAVAAYNAGPENVEKYGGIPPFPETRDYVARVAGGGFDAKGRNVADLGRLVKSKYPAYRNIPDADLGRRVKAKYPAYSGFLDLPETTAALDTVPSHVPQDARTAAAAVRLAQEEPVPALDTAAFEKASYEALTPAQRAVLQFASGAARALPSLEERVEDKFPPPQNLAEEAASVAGGVGGFSAVAIPVAAATGGLGAGPILASAIGAGTAGAAAPGTVKERIASGATMAAGSALLGGATKGVQALTKSALAARAAGAVGGAATFGAGQPIAQRAALKALGEEPPPLEPSDVARSTLELLALNLFTEGVGVATRRFRPTPAETKAAVKNVTPPRTMPDRLRPVSNQASTELGRAVADLQKAGATVFHGAGLAIDDAHVIPSLTRVFPGDPNPVRVTVYNRATGELHSVALPNITALREAMIRKLPPQLEKPVQPEAPAPRIETKPKIEGPVLTKDQFQEVQEREALRKIQEEAEAEIRTKQEQERFGTAPAAIAALERQIAERPGDKNINRWKRRLAKLKALRPPSYEDVPLRKLVEMAKTSKSESEKKAIAREVSKRQIGTSPFPADVTRASSWTVYLKRVRENAKANPDDVAAQDEAFRAEQNFEAWKKREQAKTAEPGQPAPREKPLPPTPRVPGATAPPTPEPTKLGGGGSKIVREPTAAEAATMKPGEAKVVRKETVVRVSEEVNRRVAAAERRTAGATSLEGGTPIAEERRVSLRRPEDRKLAEREVAEAEGQLAKIPKWTMRDLKSWWAAHRKGEFPTADLAEARDIVSREVESIAKHGRALLGEVAPAAPKERPKPPRRELNKFERGDFVTGVRGYSKGESGFVLGVKGPPGQQLLHVRFMSGRDAALAPSDVRVRPGSLRATEQEIARLEEIGERPTPAHYQPGVKRPPEPPPRPEVEAELERALREREGLRPIETLPAKPSKAWTATYSSSNEQFVTDTHMLFLTPAVDPKVRQRLHDVAKNKTIEESPKIDVVMQEATKGPLVKLEPLGWTSFPNRAGVAEAVAVFHDPKSGRIVFVDPQKWKLAIKAVHPDSYEQGPGTKNVPSHLKAIVLKRKGEVVGLLMPVRPSDREVADVQKMLGAPAKEVVQESRLAGGRGRARASVPPPQRARGIPIARTAPKFPSEAEARTLPEAPVPPQPPEMRKSALGAAVEKVRQVMHEFVAIANPVRYAVGPNLDLLMRAKGNIKRALFRSERAQESVRKFWDRRSKEQVLDFWNRLESGKQADPRLAQIDDSYRQRSENMFAAISRYKEIPYWENWFPHLWKDPRKAQEFFRGRRPMEGRKSFLKKRLFQDINAGLKAGLVPVSWNPEEVMQAAEHNARKYVNTQELLKDSLEIGSMKLVRVGQKPPDGFRRLNQNWARLYLNPEIGIKEAFDAQIMQGLQSVSSALGIKAERKVKIGGKRLGYSVVAHRKPSRVMTRFATPESVLAHEIGHQLDNIYGLREIFLKEPVAKGKGSGQTNRERIQIKKELQALADLRGGEGDPTFRAYVRSGEEKMAVMLEALIHAPEAFKQTAPHVYEKFVKFLASKDELRPILTIRPSLHIAEGHATVSAGGVVLGGEYWAEENYARLLDNHMSRDFISETAIGRGLMDSRNTLNSINLGVSAFHATGTTLLAMMSRMAVGISELAHGRLLTGLEKIVSSPAAPILYVRDGWKFYRGAPELAAIEQAVFAGGAALERKAYYKNQMLDRFVRNARQALAAGTPYERLGSAGKALAQAPFVAIEGPMRVLTEAYIPQMKVAAFRDLFSSQLRIKSKDIAAGKTSETDVARIAWRDVEDRFGLINYDNEFWHNTLKSSIMVMIRAPGWTLGTVRALGGALFADLPRLAASPLRGKAPEWTSRMSFALSMAFTTMALGGIYHYLHTGRRPKTLEDYLHPQNGLLDDRGRPMRVSFPTFMKDVEAWSSDPVKTLVGRRELGRGASSLGHGGKLAPEVTLMLDLLENQSYRGPIRNVQDPYYDQAGQVIRYVFGREQPFSIAQARRLLREQGTPEQVIESTLGITQYYEPSERRRRFHYREVEQ